MSGLREKIGRILLERSFKHHKRKVQAVDFKSAKTAGIIFEAGTLQDLNDVQEFVKFLSSKGIQTEVIGFFPTKRIDGNLIGDSVYSFICKKDFSYFYKPKSEHINTFVAKKHDILLNLSAKGFFETESLVVLADSPFKIGRKSSLEPHYDLMFEIEKDTPLSYLIDQIKHYLAILNFDK